MVPRPGLPEGFRMTHRDAFEDDDALLPEQPGDPAAPADADADPDADPDPDAGNDAEEDEYEPL